MELPPAVSQDGLMQSFFAAWLGGLAENTRRAYCQAWKALRNPVAFDITNGEIAAWVEKMRNRGLADTTISQRMAAIGSFYSYCQDGGIDITNPVGGKRMRPKVLPFGKAAHLNVDECKALLAAIDRSTPAGKRDFALILGYLLTGRRNSEWRRLRWEDMEIYNGRVHYRWHGKGSSRRDELPGAAWEAIAGLAKISGSPQEYRGFVFCADETGHKPLSDRQVRNIVKKYARLAGLNQARVKVHSLRHTAAMLRRDAGGDVEEVSAFLGHRSIGITQVYLHRLEGQPDGLWMKVAEMLSL